MAAALAAAAVTAPEARPSQRLAAGQAAATGSEEAPGQARAVRRAIAALEEPEARHGRLGVTAAFAPLSGAAATAGAAARWRVDALVSFADLPLLPAEAEFQVWAVLARLDDEPQVRLFEPGRQDLGGAGAWLFQGEVDLGDGFLDGAVVVEIPGTGLWGAAVIAPPDSPLDLEGLDLARYREGEPGGEPAGAPGAAAAGTGSGPAGSPARQAAGGRRAGSTLRLLPPRQRPASGRVRFSTLVSDPEIDRVAFTLNGLAAGEDDSSPFDAVLDLGAEVRPHRVRAEGFDADGRLLDADELEVNGAAGLFAVRITGLKRDSAAGLELAADVSIPAGRTLDRLEVYLNDRLIGEIRRPPYRLAIGAPELGPSDFVRAVAVLDDGSEREDARLVSATSDRIAVNLVEIYAVVTDRAGEPVADLEADDFEVRLGRRPQRLERFALAEEVPLSLGLIVDTSESMWALMPDTKQAGAKFLADTLRPQDRAFLIDFDTRPRLAHASSQDLAGLLNAFRGLEAGGYTALYDAILFGMLQYDDPDGRRALVVLTDGDDYRSHFSRRWCVQYGRQLGVPVYIVGLGGILNPYQGFPKMELDGIAAATGGRTYYISAIEDLDRVYAQINAELKSQYLLAFSTERPLDDAELDSIQVEVDAPRARVRSVVGGRLLD